MTRRLRPGVVSVVVVHTADDPVDADWLASVTAAAPAGTELVVVDAATAGGGDRPDLDGDNVRIVRSDRRGRAVARNAGAGAATGDTLAFLSTGASPAAGWLDAAAAVLRDDESVGCVAPVLHGADPAGLSFAGLPTAGSPAAPAVAADAYVLHPPADALVVRARLFAAEGGFDERYDRCGEEVDLGWRLWLLGHRVCRCMSSVVDVSGVRPPALSPDERRFLTERNALCTIYKHYDEPHLGAALPAAMALVAARAADEGDGAQAAAARAVGAFVDALPELAEVRDRLQARRRRTDQEILRLFGDPLAADGTPAGARASVAEAFGLAERFGARRRIAVVTGDSLTEKMAGPAIRAWEIAGALSVEHDVRLATTTRCEITSPQFSIEKAGERDLRELMDWCEVFVVQGWVLHGRQHLRSSSKILIVDLYDPLHLEQLELARAEGDAVRRGTVREATTALNDQLSRGDYFVCASTKQRDFWLGQMAALGRVNPLTYDEDETLDTLIGIVPFGVRDEVPVHNRNVLKGVVPGIGEDDEVILWGGGIYNWLDPVTLVRAIDKLRVRRPGVRLYFLGLRHPNPEVLEMRMAVETRDLADRLGLTGTHVFFNEGWVAYADRHNYLLEADVGVSTHLDHLETAYSFRTRILDYLWAALPVVATAGDAFAELIEREALGVTVPAGDVDALEDALFRVLDDDEFSAVCRKNLATVRGRFVWSEVLAPLVEFCRAPRRAPDLVDPEMAAALGAANSATDPRRKGLRGDVAIAVAYLREGGLQLVANKAKSRIGHRLAGRR
ncbi:MAG: glycosyltransferase [Acidimicrobiales bacterium]